MVELEVCGACGENCFEPIEIGRNLGDYYGEKIQYVGMGSFMDTVRLAVCTNCGTVKVKGINIYNN